MVQFLCHHLVVLVLSNLKSVDLSTILLSQIEFLHKEVQLSIDQCHEILLNTRKQVSGCDHGMFMLLCSKDSNRY